MSRAATLAPLLVRRRLSVSLSGSTASASGNGNGPFTTGAITATPAGGVTPHTYAWARVSGDASISISSATVAAPTWSASGTAPETKSAVWRCTVTDAAGVAVVSSNVTITVEMLLPGLSASLDTGSVSGSGNGTGPFSTGNVTCTPSGGIGPYTYLWEYVSGNATISATAGTAATTAFTASGTPEETKNAVWRCKVTDSHSQVAYSGNVSIAITFNYVALGATVDPTYVSGFADASALPTTITSGTATAGGTGGSGSYSYAWEYVSGDTDIGATAPTSAASAFSRYVTSIGIYSAVWRCKITDTVTTNTAYTANVTIDLESSP